MFTIFSGISLLIKQDNETNCNQYKLRIQNDFRLLFHEDENLSAFASCNCNTTSCTSLTVPPLS